MSKRVPVPAFNFLTERFAEHFNQDSTNGLQTAEMGLVCRSHLYIHVPNRLAWDPYRKDTTGDSVIASLSEQQLLV